ncbi:MAG: hypothetical protein QG628_455 [Patescibacteria group bacterium]|nr:hypothetical protein [Patescibacteria group bacterium]
MSVLMRWDGYGLTNSYDYLPGVTGRTDINAFNSEQSSHQNPFTVGFPSGGNVIIAASTTISSRTNVPVLQVRDYAVGITRPYVGFDSSKAFSGAPSGPFSTYSLRYYFKHAAVSPTNNLGTVGFWSGSGGLHWNGLCLQTSTGKALIPGLNGAVGNSLINQWIRVEIQVNTAFSPKIDVRWYAGDSTTLLGRFSPDPASLTPSQYVIIGEPVVSSTVNGNFSLANFEFCDTYDLDGKFPGGIASPATTTNASGTGTPVSDYTFPTDLSDGTVPSASFTTYTNQSYASDYGRNYTLYVPNGVPANSNGFPLVLWAHAGFFVAGNKEQLPDNWRNTLLNAGYAVATVRYVKSSVDTSAPYNSWGSADPFDSNTPAYGRYPSWIIDYKLAAVRIAAKCSTLSGGDGTYANVDGSKLFATGYSAGGYIALAAGVSKGLTDDGSTRDLTIAGNATYNDGYTGADPTFIGSFSYAGPIDLSVACAYDMTDQNYGPILNPSNRGIVVSAAQAFMGQVQGGSIPTLTNTSIDNLITRNVAQNGTSAVPRVGYTRTTGDYLVHWAHEPLLSAAMSSSGIASKYFSYNTATFHDKAISDFRSTDIIGFLNAATVANGGVTGFATWTPKTVIS